MAGNSEVEIGEGRNCTVATVGNKNMYAWTDNQKVILHGSRRCKKVVGGGGFPVLKALDEEHAICIWENDKQIHAAVVNF